MIRRLLLAAALALAPAAVLAQAQQWPGVSLYDTKGAPFGTAANPVVTSGGGGSGGTVTQGPAASDTSANRWPVLAYQGGAWTFGLSGPIPACSTTVPPTVSNCGTGATMSAQATDFVGQVTTGGTLVSACTVTFSKLYASLGCLAQSNTTSSSVAGAPVIGTAGGKTAMTISLTLALTAGKITYSCFPV
jgi:hypothetical protein